MERSVISNGRPVRKRTKITLDTKMKLINKYEAGQSLSSIASEFELSVSTVNTIVKDSDRIKEHVKGSVLLKSTIITKRRYGPIFAMENKLIFWMEDQIRKNIPLSLLAVQTKARSLYEELKIKYPGDTHSFVASNGWFNRFKNRAGFHYVRVKNENNDGNASNKHYPNHLVDLSGYFIQRALRDDEFINKTKSSVRGKEFMLETKENNSLRNSQENEVSIKLELPTQKSDTNRISIIEEMTMAFNEISLGLKRLEKMDPDNKRFLKIQREINNLLSCYHKIYSKEKMILHGQLEKIVKTEPPDDNFPLTPCIINENCSV